MSSIGGAQIGGGRSTAAADPTGEIKMVWMTDTHILSTTQATRDSSITGALADCNAWGADIAVHTGDIGDNYIANVRRGFVLLRGTTISCPLVTVIGNHDEEEITVPATPNTAQIEASDAFNHAAPINQTGVLTAQTGNLQMRWLTLDCNYAGDSSSGVHVAGDRIGHPTTDPLAGYVRQLGATQRAWIASTLAADRTSHAVLVFIHYPPSVGFVIDCALLADILATDGRQTALFCGHVHPNSETYTLLNTAANRRFTTYRMPASQESGDWTRVRMHMAGGQLIFDELTVKGFVNPGGWTITSPFTNGS